ncbi:major facilitator superfamily MFS_1 [Acidothermus cellulolyticus 11B]|uniref:Major facilitator superfamily MFS_1 n=1 Tax=Acidothermus cellulolyticus (strain ATCC 43068 / DSM 8971 / 11B) TaxID=351607 RepID=A0LW84_ACIC1|nr:MFS transporter [Acidothermus cellulolyticus]ABK53694.1 major facilitator superfamily MFS_1 [Acidothermus cellulolyticus 11B]
MYLTSRSRTVVSAPASDPEVALPLPRIGVSRNVVMLGIVSLITDISSEMVSAVLPLYLVFVLGTTPLTFGFLDGLYNGVTSLVQLTAGHLADRWERRKGLALTGYALSAVCKLGLLAVGSVIPAIAAVLGLDRTGKGLRTAPRDALISLSSQEHALGRAFGVHRALDTFGAFIGPLVAFVLLAAAPGRYDSIFVVSFCIAGCGVVLLAAAVREPAVPASARARPTVRRAVALLADRRMAVATAAAVALSVLTLSDAFVYLLVQRRFDIPIAWFPLLPLATSAVYMALAIPLGRLADRLGRSRVFLIGYTPLLAGYLLLGRGAVRWWTFALILVLHGAYYAATDGVLMAYISGFIPVQLRASGMAVLKTGTAAGAIVSSVLFGAAWSAWGPTQATLIFVVALGGVLALAAPWLLDVRAGGRRR